MLEGTAVYCTYGTNLSENMTIQTVCVNGRRPSRVPAPLSLPCVWRLDGVGIARGTAVRSARGVRCPPGGRCVNGRPPASLPCVWRLDGVGIARGTAAQCSWCAVPTWWAVPTLRGCAVLVGGAHPTGCAVLVVGGAHPWSLDIFSIQDKRVVGGAHPTAWRRVNERGVTQMGAGRLSSRPALNNPGS
jgi:hypothetical protein